MTDPYFNATYGTAFEGVTNYVNLITDGWFVNLFLIFIFIVTLFTLSKSEWKMSGIMAFAFFIVFISAMMFRTFTLVNGYVIFISIIGMAFGVLIGIMSKNRY